MGTLSVPSDIRSLVDWVVSVLRYYFLSGLAGSTYTGPARSVITFASVGPCFQPDAVDTCLARIWTVSLNSAASVVVPEVNRTS